MVASSFSKRRQLIFCPLTRLIWRRARRGNFNGGAGNFAVTHVEERTGNIHGKYTVFPTVHVAAKLRRYDKAAGLAPGGSYTDAAEEWM